MLKILIKRSKQSNAEPTIGQLEYGELALNYADGIIYFKDSNNTIRRIYSSLNSARTEIGTQNRISYYFDDNTIRPLSFFQVGTNNNLSIGGSPVTTYPLYVYGNTFSSNFYTSGQYYETSSLQYKTDIVEIGNMKINNNKKDSKNNNEKKKSSRNKTERKIKGGKKRDIYQSLTESLTSLNIYVFRKKDSIIDEGNEKMEVGLIAEEVEKMFPDFDLVKNNSLSYSRLSVLCIVALKELKRQIVSLEDRVKELEEANKGK